MKRFTALDASFTIENAEIVSLSELNIPFLTRQIKDQTGIRVRLTPGKIKWGPPLTGIEDPYVRHFTVYLDADAKRIFAVTSRLAERSPDIHAELSPEEAERRLRATGAIYDSFPMADPKISFLEALETMRQSSIANPPLAQEIDGFYIMYGSLDLSDGTFRQKPHPVWIINLRGLPPREFHNPYLEGGSSHKQPPAWRRNSTRDIVDAVTGKWIVGYTDR